MSEKNGFRNCPEIVLPKPIQAGAAVSECNRLRDLLQTCEAANKCLSMRVGVEATDLAQVVELETRIALLEEKNIKLVATLKERDATIRVLKAALLKEVKT